MKYADLHLHTCFSDSTFTPAELIEACKEAQVSCISVVDHDTVDGVGPVLKAAGGSGIEVIPGIELTAEYSGQEVHILGYFIDYKNRDLSKKLSGLRENRNERIYKMAEKLNGLGVDIKPESIFNVADKGIPGRMHVAMAMLKQKFVSSIPEAFNKYLGDGKPAYVMGFRYSHKEGIKLIKDMGGIAVLAHPYIVRKQEGIAELIDDGIEGLEVFYPEHGQSLVNYYLRLAEERGLVVTGGSDCHGLAKPDVKVGDLKLDYKYVEQLKGRAGRDK